MPILDTLKQNPLIPVITIEDSAHAKPLADCLLEAGIRIFEITLRTEAAYKAMLVIKQHFPEAIVGAGTVTKVEQMQAILDLNIDFAVSPGLNDSLVNFARDNDLPYLPGVSTCSEMMHAMQLDLTCLKLFPANLVGGMSFLKQLANLFPSLHFCPTGGVGINNYKDFLALPNVVAIGGSFLAPTKLMQAGDWEGIKVMLKQL